MKVLIATGIYPPESGGPSQYARGMALALGERNISVSVITYGESGDSKEDGFPVTRVSRSGGPVIRYLRFLLRAWKLAKQHDVVFLQGAVSEGWPSTIGAKLAKKPTVLRVPGDYAWEMAMQSSNKYQVSSNELLDQFLERKHGGRIGLYEKMERYVARSSCRLIAPSQYLQGVLMKWGVPEERIHVIWNAEHSLPMHYSRERARKEYGVSDRVVCLTVVRAVPWKGVAELIEWWDALPSSHVLVVGGDGPEYERWKKLAEPLGERVRFVGRLARPELADWYRASDVFILHSGYEGYPHVVAEAASLSVPCLVSDQGGNPETKERFGDLITVLPFRRKESWMQALKDVDVRDERAASAPSWTHRQMVDRVLEVLNLCASS